MRPALISSTTNSKDWYNFEIVSFRDGLSTTHATGSIRCHSIDQKLTRELQVSSKLMEPTATRIWYEKLIKEGLNFGKAFQSITEVQTHRQKTHRHATTKV